MEQILLFAILKSALYTLVALGLTLLFGVGGVLNLAHGTLLMVSAYVAYTAFDMIGFPLPISLASGVVAAALLAMGLYWGMIRRVQESPILTLIITLAVALAFQEGAALAFGAAVRSLPPPAAGVSEVLGVPVENVRLAAFAVAWLAIGAFWLFIERTRLGKGVRAAAMSRVGAALIGIDIERTYLLIWGISGALAGLAGAFIAYPGGMDPRMWIDPLLIAFAIVILGGLGSLAGSLIAAHLVGFVETFTFYAPLVDIPLGASWVGVPSLAIIVLILIFRPHGLFGRPAL